MLTMVIDPRRADLGHGLLVQRILPFAKRRMVGPFIFLDHAGPVQLPAEEVHKVDVRPHPHIGLSTVSYLFSGNVTHRDSLGVKQVIVPGEVNWMTAGRGISHSERFEDPAAFAGTGLELLQSWVALPEEDEETDPSFDNYPVDALPEARDGDIWMRLIAGDAYGFGVGGFDGADGCVEQCVVTAEVEDVDVQSNDRAPVHRNGISRHGDAVGQSSDRGRALADDDPDRSRGATATAQVGEGLEAHTAPAHMSRVCVSTADVPSSFHRSARIHVAGSGMNLPPSFVQSIVLRFASTAATIRANRSAFGFSFAKAASASFRASFLG